MRAPDYGGNHGSSATLSRTQGQSTAPSGTQGHSAAINGNHGQSTAINGNQRQSTAINGSHLLASLERISFLSKLAFLADGRWHRALTQRDGVLPGTEPRLPTRLCTASEHVTNLSEGDESQRG